MNEQEHYFTAAPATPAQRRTMTVELAGRQVSVQTAAGIFSPDRIDIGTAVLLREVPDPPPSGALLDLGCGWGPVALTLGLCSPDADVYAVDVNERALDLARTNAISLGLNRIRVCRPRGGPRRRPVRGDLVQPSDPSRQGRPARPVAHLAAEAGTRRDGIPRRPEEPRK